MLAVHLQDPFFAIGFTTMGPDSGPVLLNLGDFCRSDQHWYVTIDNHGHTIQYKGQLGRLPCQLAESKGRTVSCRVSEKGEFCLCTRESNLGDIMGKGLPTDRPLRGFVAFHGKWKVDANYKVAMSKGKTAVHMQYCTTALAA